MCVDYYSCVCRLLFVCVLFIPVSGMNAKPPVNNYQLHSDTITFIFILLEGPHIFILRSSFVHNYIYFIRYTVTICLEMHCISGVYEDGVPKLIDLIVLRKSGIL